MALSEYEEQRLANIARNRAVMIKLGLIDEDVAEHEKATTKEKKKATQKKRREPVAPTEPTRRSKRLAGAAEEEPEQQQEEEEEEAPEHALEKAEHLRWAGQQKRASVVGTASYEHTLMRVRSMSDKALWTRLKTIERAKGQHAVAKMRLFGRIAFLEKKHDLAEACVDALARLIEDLGDTTENTTE